MNILKEKPYIQKLIGVVKSSMQRTPRKITVNGRLSDAFVYIISGECDYYFEDELKFTASPGTVIYLSNNAVYRMKLQTENYSFIYVDFLFEDGKKYESAIYKNDCDYLTLFKKLYSDYKNVQSENKIICMRRLYNIYESICIQNEQAYLPSTLKDRIKKCKDYMDLHYDDKDLSVTALSQIAEMSEVYFRKVFQSIYKISPKKYLTHIRLNRAADLLKYSFISLDKCASMCGFTSAEYFSRVFKNELGATPAAYRKKM